MFLSVLYGVIDIRNHKLCFASCGHNPPVMRRADKVRHRWTHDNAPVLGIMPSSQLDGYLHEEFIQLQPDDQVLFYTDGLTEAFNATEQMFGEARLVEHFRFASQAKPAEVVQGIRMAVDAFRADAPLTDDETMVVMRIGQPNSNPAPLVKGGVLAESSLPVFTSPLVGRDSDIAELALLLKARETTLITLTGAAGAG
jgi:serine phosphatase RsbU (regulator of sigma subunit)